MVKITKANRELRPEDLRGAKQVFCVAHARLITAAGEFIGWFWHHGLEWDNDDLHGPFCTQKAARDHAFANARMMQ